MTRFVVFVFVFTLVVALALVLLRGVLSAAAVVALATLGAEQEQSGGEQMHEGAMPSCCSVHPSPRLWVATLVWPALAVAVPVLAPVAVAVLPG